jgi:cell division inhibitor SepF
MSGLSQAVRNFRNIWGQADEDYTPDDIDETDPDAALSARSNYQSSSYPSSQSASTHTSAPTAHGGSGGGASRARRLHALPHPLRSREKNIYTIKPKSQEDAAIAADYLKSGDAVIVNLEDVDRVNAVRIIDFMSGVCYGLENQGHAMKLGDAIFLYTPGDFEIRSDEVDYGENEDFFFRDEKPMMQPAPSSTAPTHVGSLQPTATQSAPSAASAPPTASGYINPGAPAPNAPYQSADRRPWER